MRHVLGPGPEPAQTLDRGDIQMMLRSMVDALAELSWPDGPDTWRQRPPWLIGIHHGGVAVAQELSDIIFLSEGFRPPMGTLDVTLYRDDAWLKAPRAAAGRTALPGDPSGQRILLVDDVLHTGRTVRAALHELLDYGRPAAVKLAVLVDRQGRELPIDAEIVGQSVAMAAGESLRLTYDADGRIDGASRWIGASKDER